MRIYCLASFLDPGKITGMTRGTDVDFLTFIEANLLDCENPLKMWWVLINNVLGFFFITSLSISLWELPWRDQLRKLH